MRGWLPLITIIFFAVLAAGVAADDTAPTIELNSPLDDSSFFFGNIDFKYTPDDAAGVYRCTLFINETLARTSSEISNDAENTFTHNMLDGIYDWSIYCEDPDGNNHTTTNRTLKIFSDTQVPNVTVQTFLETEKKSSIQFNYTVVENGSGIDNCKLFIDNAEVQTSTSVNDNETQHFTYSVDEGDSNWYVKCTDEHGNYQDSGTSQVTVMLPPKVVLLSPENNHETDASTLIFKYIPTSTRNIARCDLLFNNVTNKSIFVIDNGVEQSFEITRIPTRVIDWTVECKDSEDLLGRADERALIVTTTDILESEAPGVLLVHPVDISVVNGSKFSFKATSELVDISICELYIDDLWNATDAEVESGVQQDFDFTVFELGEYIWQVTCMNERGQTTVSDNATFIIVDELPDDIDGVNPKIDEDIDDETIAELTGRSKLKGAIKMMFYLLVPLLIVVWLVKRQMRDPYGATGQYSRRG